MKRQFSKERLTRDAAKQRKPRRETMREADSGAMAVAWEFRQRSAVGNGPQRNTKWCDWCSIDRETYDRFLREPNELIQARSLYTIPDAAQARIRELEKIASDMESYGLSYWADKLRDALTSSARPTQQGEEKCSCGVMCQDIGGGRCRYQQAARKDQSNG